MGTANQLSESYKILFIEGIVIALVDPEIVDIVEDMTSEELKELALKMLRVHNFKPDDVHVEIMEGMGNPENDPIDFVINKDLEILNPNWNGTKNSQLAEEVTSG